MADALYLQGKLLSAKSNKFNSIEQNSQSKTCFEQAAAFYLKLSKPVEAMRVQFLLLSLEESE